MKPFSSRLTCQQSSITTFWYPASFIPLETIASAMDLIISSLTLQPNLFQLFQPIGGVSATPLSQAFATGEKAKRKIVAKKMENILAGKLVFMRASGTEIAVLP